MSSTNGRFGDVASGPDSATIRVDVRDERGATSSKSFDLVVIELFATTSLVDEIECTVGLSCMFLPMVARGGEPPYVYSITDGVLVDGMTLDPSSGEISGTPTVAADDALTVTVTDQAGSQLSDTVRFVVLEELSTTREIPEQVCAVNEECAFVPVTASGGRPPYRFTLNEGALPAGMTFDEVTGAFAGAPVEIVDRQVTVTVTDDRENTSVKVFRLLVTQELVVRVRYPEQNCARGAPCSFTPLDVSGGRPPYRYQITAGALPPGLTFEPTLGLFSGTPETLFDDMLRVTVTDAVGAQDSGSFRLIVGSGLVTTLTAARQICTAQHTCEFTPVTVAGGTPPYRFATNSLPSGMTFNPLTGAFGGAPTGVADLPITVTVGDDAGGSGSETFQLVVNPPLETQQHIAAMECLVLTPCDFLPVSASGGTPPYLFTYTTGQLPPGMTFAPSTGRFSGVPTAVTLQLFNVVVTDAVGASDLREVGLSTRATLSATLAIPTQHCEMLEPCEFIPVHGSYGWPPYRYELSVGELPPGMTFDPATGQFGGAPEEVFDGSLTVTVRDEADFAASQEFRLIVLASGPATVRWMNPAGGSWSDSRNWDIGRVPRDGDDVEIQLDGDYLVRIEDDQDITVRSLTLGGGTGSQRLIAVHSTRGTILLTDGARILDGGELTLRRHTLAGGPVLNEQGGSLILNWADVESDLENRGTLEVLGYSENFHPQWSHISGALTTTSSSLIRLFGEGTFTQRRRGNLSVAEGFVNHGSLILDNEFGDFNRHNGVELRVLSGTLTNAESGRIELLADSINIQTMEGNVATLNVPELVNAGDMTGTGLTDLSVDRIVNQGRLHVRNVGRFSVQEFENRGITELSGGSGTGIHARVTVTLREGGAGLTNSGTLQIDTGHEFLVRDGAFTNTGTIRGDGTLRGWDADIVMPSSLPLGGEGLTALSLDRVTFDGPAPSTSSGAFLELINWRIAWDSPLVNAEGSTVHLEGVIFDSDVENRGLLRVLPTRSVSQMVNGQATDFTGTLTTTETSQIEVLNQHVFVSTSHAIDLNLAQELTNNGSLRISATSSVGAIRVRVLAGGLVNAVSGSLEVDGGTGSILYGPFENHGAMTLGVGGFSVEAAGADVVNSGSIDATAPILHTQRPTLRVRARTFTHSGTLDAGEGAGELDFVLASDGGFTTTGSVAIHADRTLRVTNGTFDYAGGTITGGGTLHLTDVTAVFQQPVDLGTGDLQVLVMDNSTLSAPGLNNTGGGTLRLVNTTVDAPNPFVNAAGGTLDLAGSTFNGDIDNRGLLRVFPAWNTWESAINGTFSTSPGSRLEVRDFDPVGNRSGSVALRFSGGFTNQGEILMSSAASYIPTLQMDGGALVNSAGGSLEFSGSSPTASTRFRGPLQNDGALTLTGGRLLLEAPGAAVVNNGTMTLSSATSQPTLTLTASTFTNNGTFDAGTGSGELSFTLASDGGFANTGTVALSSDRTLRVTEGTFDYAGGGFTGGGTLHLTNVTALFQQGLDLGTGDLQSLILDTSTLTAPGMTNTGGGTLRLVNTTVDAPNPFVNAAGGTLDLAGSTFNGDIDNRGLVRAFPAWGTAESHINGTFSTSTGSRLEVRDFDPVGNRSGSIVLRLSESLTNEGDIFLSSTSGYIPTLRMDGGTLVNAPGGTLELFGSTTTASMWIRGPLQNDGALTLTGGRFFLEAPGAAVVNNGTMTLSSATSQPTLTLTASTFTNNGTFDASAGSGQLTLTLASEGGFTNAGEVLVGTRDLSIAGALVVPAASLGAFQGSGGIAASGLDVDGAVFRGVRLTSTGGALARFDNVTFADMDPTTTQLTVNHPGAAAQYTFDGVSFLQTPTTGRYILASDTNGSDGAPLVIELTNSVPADGSAHTEVAGGAEVRWQ